jgi:hypothetical protein
MIYTVLLDFIFVAARFVYFYFPQQDSPGSSPFPAACMNQAVKHMECLINKRETAYQTAVKLAGKEACERVFPYYEDNKKKALDMMEVYKHDAAGEKKDVFWG